MSRFEDFVREDKFSAGAGWVCGEPEEYAGESSYDDDDDDDDGNSTFSYPIGMTVDLVESHGGEGEGDSAWAVYKVTDDGVVKHYRCNGSYASYDGFYFDGDVEEVEPYEKTVIDWAKA